MINTIWNYGFIGKCIEHEILLLNLIFFSNNIRSIMYIFLECGTKSQIDRFEKLLIFF